MKGGRAYHCKTHGNMDKACECFPESETAWFLKFSDVQEVCRFRCNSKLAMADYGIDADHDICLTMSLSDHEAKTSACSEDNCYLILNKKA